jgi:multidrug transporter EmrE-like cation transporter
MNYLMIAAGLACSAGAQVMLKLASAHTAPSKAWLLPMGGAACLYAVSFVLYSLILKRGALSRIGPSMTVGVAILVVLAGLLFFGERLSPRQGLGLGLGLAALVLLLA